MAGRLRHLGLRYRLVAALMFTATVTLGAAALALLPPLEHRLRQDELEALTAAAITARSSFDAVARSDVRSHAPRLQPVANELERRTRALCDTARGMESRSLG